MSLDVNINVQGLDIIAEAINALTRAILARPEALPQSNTATDDQPTLFAAPEKSEESAPAQAEPKPAAQSDLPQPGSISRATVRTKFTELAKAGKRAQLKEVLGMFGADNVSSLADNVLHQVYDVLKGLS